MSKFSSNTVRVDRSASEISNKFSDLTQLQTIVDQLPSDEREKLGQVEFTTDSIVLNTAQVGSIRFEAVERTPQLVKFKAVGAPVNVELYANLAPVDTEATDVTVVIEMDLPMMLRPLVAPHMQKAVDMLAGVIANVAAR